MTRFRLFVAVAMALVIGVSLPSVAAATQRSSAYPSNPVYGCNGGLCTNAYFSVVWQIRLERDAGITYNVVSRMEMAAVLKNAKRAANDLGVHPKQIGWNAQFLNSAGTVVAQLYPPLDVSCYSSLVGPDDILLKACRVSDYRVSLSATKVRFNFFVVDTSKNGLGWGASWTTSLG